MAVEELLEVVDIGANPIGPPPTYKPLLDAGLARVTGFEPQPEALALLNAAKGPFERYFPYVIGDGQSHTLHVCRQSGMTSLLEPDPRVTERFPELAVNTEVIDRETVRTRRLDDIAEIDRIDLLNIDVQGAELMIFQGGRDKLSQAVAIFTEVAFLPFYKGQPTFADIDRELRSQGFIPHRLSRGRAFSTLPPTLGSQLIDGDALYLRDFTRPMPDEQLRRLALICSSYGSADLAQSLRPG